MKTILGVEIPADLTTLSSDELKTLRADLRAAATLAAAGDVTAEVLADIKSARALANDAKGIVADRVAADDALAADLAAEVAALAEDSDDEAEDGPEDEDDAEGDEGDEGEGDAEGEGGGEGGVQASAGYQPRVRAGQLAPVPTGPVVVPDAVLPPRQTIGDLTAAGHVFASSGVNGMVAGEAIADMRGLGTALLDRYEAISGGGTEKMKVAIIPSAYTADQILGDNIESNLMLFGGKDFRTPQAQKAITAAMCAPVEPYYGLGATSSTERPVKGSMPSYRAPRGGVTVYPTPRLSDVDNGAGGDGTGIWTRANDADANAVKAACALIPCASPIQYDIYGIYRCMTIKNMLQLTFPELVDAYLNRLAALQARLAEETMLDAMVGSVNTKAVAVNGTNLDGAIDLWTTIENAVCVYREEERYTSEVLDFRTHRWVRSAVKIGLMRQKRTSGKLSDRLPTDMEVDAAFRNLGVEPTWTLDYASNWARVPAQVDGAQLAVLPRTVDFLLSARGNFRALDEGTLNIGVANNVMRDNTSLSKNQFTMFFENYEGIIDFGAISYAVSITGFCPNGAQTADVASITCNTVSS